MSMTHSDMSLATDTPIRREVREVILELAPNPNVQMDNPRLVEDLAYHSLALLELAFALEDRYDLPPIKHEAAAQLTTLAQVVDFVVNNIRS
jgi:acyl carrier protein